jgi:hypothetical protein
MMAVTTAEIFCPKSKRSIVIVTDYIGTLPVMQQAIDFEKRDIVNRYM